MSHFSSPVLLPEIPDNLSIPQFFLQNTSRSLLRPQRPSSAPFFIEDRTSRQITYDQVRHRTNNLANALNAKWNIGKGDVVCLFSPNHIEYAIIVWAVQVLGGIITPANPAFTADELGYQLSTTRAKLIVVHPTCFTAALLAGQKVGLTGDFLILLEKSNAPLPCAVPTIEQLITFGSSKPESFKPLSLKTGEAKTTLAFLSFSSGTTGKPKAVAISHYGVISNVIQMASHYRLNDPSWPDKRMSPGDVVLGVLPFFHIYGLIVTLHFMLYCGLSIVVVPKFSFSSFMESIVRHRVTHLYLVPPQIVLLCKHSSLKGYDFSHVKFCMSGAAPLSGELMRRISTIFPNAAVGQGYGLTETCTTVCLMQADRKLGTIGGVGELLPGITAKVVKPDGTLASDGEQGELVVKGPSMALGYYENLTATGEIFVDGWVRTGDEVIIRNLEIFIVDRLKEIMKVRGYQVAPAELEGFLLLRSDVMDVCVVSIPDEYSGEVPLAFIVLDPDTQKRVRGDQSASVALKKAIQKYVSDAKVQYKWLAGGVEFIDVVPRNPSGKILRRLLRDQARSTAKTKTRQHKL